VPLDEFRLEIEEVDVARGPRHEELDDAFGAGRMVEGGGRSEIRSRSGGSGVVAQQCGQGESAEALANVLQ
jgi:hypothetical protein